MATTRCRTWCKVGKTLLVASGSHGKFVSRLDLDVRNGEVKDYGFKLIPVFADAIAPDPQMAARIRAVRAPHEAMLREVIGRTETLLYRRGNFSGTLDDLICDALHLPSATPRSRCLQAFVGAARCCPTARSRARISSTPPPSPIRPPIA